MVKIQNTPRFLRGPLAALITVSGLAFASALILPYPGVAETVSRTDKTTAKIAVSDAWMRKPLVSGGNSAAYLTLKNLSDSDQLLIKAATPVAKSVELHTHLHENGVMKMRRLKNGIPIAAGATVTLRPGGLHIMLFGVDKNSASGGKVPLTLTLANVAPVTVMMDVRPATSSKPKAGKMHRGSHH